MAKRRRNRKSSSARSRVLGRTTSGRLLRGVTVLGAAGAGGYALSRRGSSTPKPPSQMYKPPTTN